MAEIVVSEFMDEAIARDGFAHRDLLFDPALVDDRERLLNQLADAKALIVRNRTQVDVELLDRAPELRVIGRLGVGLDNIDVEGCRARAVEVCPATGANDGAVAEYVITAALILLRGAWASTSAVHKGEWPRNELIGRELAAARLGLIGYGAIARQTAARAQALGMSVGAYDPYLTADSDAWGRTQSCGFEEVLATSDVVSLHTPLTKETRHLIDESAISIMKPSAVLINAARGGVVDEQALAQALRAGRLAGAALDVFEVEPLTEEAGQRFEGLENILLTPHIAGITQQSNLRVSQVTVEKVLAVLAKAKTSS